MHFITVTRNVLFVRLLCGFRRYADFTAPTCDIQEIREFTFDGRSQAIDVLQHERTLKLQHFRFLRYYGPRSAYSPRTQQGKGSFMTQSQPSWVQRVVSPHISSIPPYVPGKPLEELEREYGITDALKMASNENPLGPSPGSLQALRDHLNRVHMYPEDGAPLLRSALARRFGIRSESVILGNGSDEVLSLCCHLFVRPGSESIVGSSTFSMYRIFTEGYGGRVIRVPMRDHEFDLPAMARAVTDKTRLVFLAVPNNPTGSTINRSDFEAFLAELPSEGLVVVVDEAYREFVADEDCLFGLDYLDREVPILVLRTFSKFFSLAGLRIGYGIAQPWLVELFNRIRPPFTVNALAQKAAMAALEDIEHQEMTLENNRAGLEFLTNELRAMGMEVIPSAANFITFCTGSNAGPVYEGLLREGVIVRHLASFGMEKCIRVTIGRPEENERFIGALTKILEA